MWGGPVLTPLYPSEELTEEGLLVEEPGTMPTQSYVLLPPEEESARDLPQCMQEIVEPSPMLIVPPEYCVVVVRHLELETFDEAMQYAKRILETKECSHSALVVVVYTARAISAVAICRVPKRTTYGFRCKHYAGDITRKDLPPKVSQRLAEAATATDVPQLIRIWADALAIAEPPKPELTGFVKRRERFIFKRQDRNEPPTDFDADDTQESSPEILLPPEDIQRLIHAVTDFDDPFEHSEEH